MLPPRLNTLRFQNWQMLSGGMKVGVSIGQQLLTDWLMHHFGLQ
jgi:hypothetical protein